MPKKSKTTKERELICGGDPDEKYPVPRDEAFAGPAGGLQDFIDAADLADIGTDLVATRDELRHLGEARIHHRWKLAGGASGGKATLGKCVKASGLVAHYSEADFIVWLAADHCRVLELTRWQVEALLYHELCHAIEALDADGNPAGWKVRSHDFEGFRSEVERYGLWQADLVEAAHALAPQLELFEMAAGGA